jgi:hypothetical protein
MLGADNLFGSVALCFGERILDLRNGFFRPIEVDRCRKTLLKQRQYIFKGGNHLRIDFPQFSRFARADERRARPLDLKNGPAKNPGIYCAFGAGTIFCVWWLLRRGGAYMYRLL